MIHLAAQTLAWVLAHPWTVAGGLVLSLSLMAGSIMLNPDGVQLRDKLRRKR